MKHELENEALESESFRGEDLAGLRTTNCTFHACDFTNARLNGSEHTGSDFANSIFENVNLFGATFDRWKLVPSNNAVDHGPWRREIIAIRARLSCQNVVEKTAPVALSHVEPWA